MCSGGEEVSYTHSAATVDNAAHLTVVDFKKGFYDLKTVIPSKFFAQL